jgi:hypothetical protein
MSLISNIGVYNGLGYEVYFFSWMGKDVVGMSRVNDQGRKVVCEQIYSNPEEEYLVKALDFMSRDIVNQNHSGKFQESLKDISINGMLSDCLPVATAFEYMAKRGDDIDDETELTALQQREYNMLQNILSMDVSIYLTRRTSGLCGSVIDDLRDMRRVFISKYNSCYDRKYINYNEDVDF